jgi:spore maturation protein CgeB
MKLMILDALRPHLNPNPDIVESVVAACQRVLPASCVCLANRWNLDRVAAAERPDVIVAFSSRIWPDLVAPLCVARRRWGVTVGWWFTDDPYEIDCSLNAAPLFDFVATNDRASMSAYWGTHVYHVPLAADPARHYRPLRTADSSYQWDILFCGVAFPNRLALIKAVDPLLRRRKTLIIGPDWPNLPYTCSQRINNVELANLYNASRIVLNLSRSFDLENSARIPASTPAPRTFEAAAAGGFQLMFDDRPETREYFQAPEEIDFFSGPGELEAKIERYLADPPNRIATAQRAQRRTLRQHTYEQRVRTLVEHLQQLRKPTRSETTAAASPHVAPPPHVPMSILATPETVGSRQ